MVSNLRCGSDYSFYLRAFNRLGEGQASQVVHVATNGSGTVPKQLNNSRHLCQFTGLEATGRVCLCVCVCVRARTRKLSNLGSYQARSLLSRLVSIISVHVFASLQAKND